MRGEPLRRGPLSGLLLDARDSEHAALVCAVEGYARGLVASEPVAIFVDRIGVLLVGSTALGVVDEVSDVDLELVCPASLSDRIVRAHREAGLIGPADDLFVELTLSDGRKGHYTLLTLERLSYDLEEGAASALWLAATAHVLHDPLGVSDLLSRHYPMDEATLLALRRATYIGFRQASRTMDNAAERGDRWALLFASVEAVREALRCALAIEGVPAPYDKWLYAVASRFPTSSAVAREAGACLDLLGEQSSYRSGPHKQNPLVLSVERMRGILIEALHEREVHEPWITEWWKHLG